MNSTSKQHKSSFFDQEYMVVRLVPYGKVTSYGAIARYIASGGSSRMVGWAMNSAHTVIANPVPAHRVVNRNGVLTGKQHFGHPLAMQNLLESEGVKIENDTVCHFKQIFWDPCVELPPIETLNN